MPDAAYVGFLDLLKTNVTNYIGAILITDFSGVPVEFRCTHPDMRIPGHVDHPFRRDVDHPFRRDVDH